MQGSLDFDDYPSLDLEMLDGGVLKITFRAPERLNALDAAMHTDLAGIWHAIDRDDDVRAVLVTGHGRNFSSGGDLELVEEITRDFDARARVVKEARELVLEVLDCSKPIVSAMRGAAVGAGLVVGLLADVSVVSPNARIIDGHTRLGVPAGDHAAIIWPLLCGMAKAKYHLLLCEPMDGREAERLGLVSLCVEDDELDDKALEIAHRLAGGSTMAIRWTKHALNYWLRQAGPIFDTSLALEFLAFTGPDVHEGIAAVREKRRPRFEEKTPEEAG